MIGYGEYWTAGVDTAQWSAVFNPKSYNWVDFTFISLWLDYDRKMRSWTFEGFLLGCRVWVCVGWDEPDEEVMTALREVAGDSIPAKRP